VKVPANALIGVALVALLVAASLLATVWTPYDPLLLDLPARLSPPSLKHWFGTDEYGRDVLSRVMAGASISAMLAGLTVSFAVITGTLIGVVAGYVGGWTDRILMVVNDALLAFPSILIAMALMMVVGSNKYGIVLALGLAYMPSIVRITRSTTLSLREKEFVEASLSIGGSHSYTMLRHVLPNSLAPIAVMASSLFGWVLLVESALSFLGIGVPPPAPTWGNMLAAGRPYLEQCLWLGLAPGICIALAVLGFNLLGDALRDRLDPRMASR